MSHSLVPGGPVGGNTLFRGPSVIVGSCSNALVSRRPRRRRERVLILGGSPLGVSHPRDRAAGVPPVHHRRGVDNAGNLGRVIEAAPADRIVVALAERTGDLPLGRLVESLARGMWSRDVAEIYERLTRTLALEALFTQPRHLLRRFRTSRLQHALARALGLLVGMD